MRLKALFERLFANLHLLKIEFIIIHHKEILSISPKLSYKFRTFFSKEKKKKLYILYSETNISGYFPLCFLNICLTFLCLTMHVWYAGLSNNGGLTVLTVLRHALLFHTSHSSTHFFLSTLLIISSLLLSPFLGVCVAKLSMLQNFCFQARSHGVFFWVTSNHHKKSGQALFYA